MIFAIRRASLIVQYLTLSSCDYARISVVTYLICTRYDLIFWLTRDYINDRNPRSPFFPSKFSLFSIISLFPLHSSGAKT